MAGVVGVQAVREVQTHRIVHADLKLNNFLLVGNAVKLIDFGIAKPLPEDQTCLARPHAVSAAIPAHAPD
jgi:serine/threonine-protein kinase TTK/MPS1